MDNGLDKEITMFAGLSAIKNTKVSSLKQEFAIFKEWKNLQL